MTKLEMPNIMKFPMNWRSEGGDIETYTPKDLVEKLTKSCPGISAYQHPDGRAGVTLEDFQSGDSVTVTLFPDGTVTVEEGSRGSVTARMSDLMNLRLYNESRYSSCFECSLKFAQQERCDTEPSCLEVLVTAIRQALGLPTGDCTCGLDAVVQSTSPTKNTST
jgi:hypothetical protein